MAYGRTLHSEKRSSCNHREYRKKATKKLRRRREKKEILLSFNG